MPRWGGVYIYNANNGSQIQADDAMQTFLTQFLDLIGIELNKVIRLKFDFKLGYFLK